MSTLDPFKYFDGQQQGVKQRLAEKIKSKFDKLTYSQGLSLAQDEKTRIALARILGDDFEAVDSSLTKSLASPLGIRIDECFGDFSDEFEQDKEEWDKLAVSEGFAAVGGGSPDIMDGNTQIRLFVLLKAIDSL